MKTSLNYKLTQVDAGCDAMLEAVLEAAKAVSDLHLGSSKKSQAELISAAHAAILDAYTKAYDAKLKLIFGEE
jgi:hypothetical protein